MKCCEITFVWINGGPNHMLYPGDSVKDALGWAADNVPKRMGDELYKVFVQPTTYDGVVSLSGTLAKPPKPTRSLADALLDLGTRVGLFRKP